MLGRGGGSGDGCEHTEETSCVREELSRNCVLRSGGDGEFDGCWRWRVDAQAAGAIEHP